MFDDTLKQGLSTQLSQSPFLNLLPEEKVSEALKLMGRSSGERLTQKVAREICLRSGSTAMLAGTISTLGNQYVISLKTENCSSGEVLAQEQVQIAAKEEVLKALGKAATRMRTKLRESLGTVQKYDTPLEQATTSSLEALQAFSEGIKIKMIRAAVELNRGHPEQAIEHLQATSDYELASPPPESAIGATLYPAYLRGLAYLPAGDAQRSASEFRKLIDNRSIVQNVILGALAHLQLGRAQAKALPGDLARASKAYQDFFALWKDADPDIPILKQARAEYAKLQ